MYLTLYFLSQVENDSRFYAVKRRQRNYGDSDQDSCVVNVHVGPVMTPSHRNIQVRRRYIMMVTAYGAF